MKSNTWLLRLGFAESLTPGLALLTLLVVDLFLIVSFPFLGPLLPVLIVLGLVFLAQCFVSEIGFILLLCVISQINMIGTMDFGIIRNVKWALTAVVGAVMVLQLISQSKLRDYEFDFLSKYFFLYFFWGLFCTITALHPLDHAVWVTSKSLYLVIFLVTFFAVSKAKHLDTISFAVLITILASCTFSFAGFIGNQFTRFRGFLDNANGFAVYLSFALTLIVPTMLSCKKRVLKALYIVGTILAFACIGLAWSREIWITSGLATIIFLILENHKKILSAVIGAMVIAAVAIVSTPSVYSLFYTLARLGFGTTHRTTLWQASIDQIVSSPLTGKGFALTVGDVMTGRDANFDTHLFLQNVQGAFNSHNYYLAVVLATGLPGIMILLWFLYKLYVHLFQCHKHAENARVRIIYAVLLASSLSVAVGFFFDTGSLMSTGSYANYFWIALGMAEAARRKHLFGKAPLSTPA